MLRGLLAVVLLFLVSAAKAAEPLNVVVLDICSARADRFGAYGGPAGLTPGLDAFAKEAAVFENAWAQSSWCLPNYATLMTGHRPEVHGLYTNLPEKGLPAWEETVAERLHASGYRTGGFTAGAYTLPAWGLDRGFDTYVNHFSTSEVLPGRFADMTGEIEQWIAKSSSQPFFLYATVDDLHAPYRGDDEVALDTDTLSVGFFRAYNGEPSALTEKADAYKKNPAALAALTRRYEGAVKATDRSIARFLADLKKRGLWEKTIVIVTADHGELLGEHGLLGHTEGLYEPTLRVPLFVRHPGLKAGRVKALVERIDLPPTMLEAAGASLDGLELQGRSLMPLLRDPASPWRSFAYASSKRNVGAGKERAIDERAVRDERWKLIWSMPKGRWQLFDLREDPLEKTDLAARRPEEAARLSFELQRLSEEARSHAPGRPSGKTDIPELRLERSPY